MKLFLYFCTVIIKTNNNSGLSGQFFMGHISENTHTQLIDQINSLKQQLSDAQSELAMLRDRVKEQTLSNELEQAASHEHNSPFLSELRLQVADMQKLNALMNVVLNNVPVYIFMKDVNNDFRYLYWNQTFANYSGIDMCSVIGKNDYEIFSNREDMDRFRADDIRTVNEGRLEFIERYFTPNNEVRIVKTVKTRVDSGDNTFLVGVSWDITDIKNVEEELIAARTKAEESDRLKTAFLANMTHEIRTPLNAIVGFSKLISEAESKSDQTMYADIIDKNSDMLLKLFDDILDLSALESGTMNFSVRSLRVSDLCTQLVSFYRSKLVGDVKINIDMVDDELLIDGDAEKIMQICGHLLSNAVKFTTKGVINIGYYKKDDNLLFYVKDTGIGIQPSRASSIFQRFDKVDSFVQGTGIGLSICRMLVEKMGGKIWLRSAFGNGSTFFFTVPLLAKVSQDQHSFEKIG